MRRDQRNGSIGLESMTRRCATDFVTLRSGRVGTVKEVV